MKTQGFEARFSQNLAPVSPEKPQNPYLTYISHLFSQPQIGFAAKSFSWGLVGCRVLAIFIWSIT
jgi:hypothetical protein